MLPYLIWYFILNSSSSWGRQSFAARFCCSFLSYIKRVTSWNVTRYTVGKITPIQRRDIRTSDFGPRASFWMYFPKGGSQLTPTHQSEDFKWKDYCPMVFRLVVCYLLFNNGWKTLSSCMHIGFFRARCGFQLRFIMHVLFFFLSFCFYLFIFLRYVYCMSDQWTSLILRNRCSSVAIMLFLGVFWGIFTNLSAFWICYTHIETEMASCYLLCRSCIIRTSIWFYSGYHIWDFVKAGLALVEVKWGMHARPK